MKWRSLSRRGSRKEVLNKRGFQEKRPALPPTAETERGALMCCGSRDAQDGQLSLSKHPGQPLHLVLTDSEPWRKQVTGQAGTCCAPAAFCWRWGGRRSNAVGSPRSLILTGSHPHLNQALCAFSHDRGNDLLICVIVLMPVAPFSCNFHGANAFSASHPVGTATESLFSKSLWERSITPISQMKKVRS